MVIDIFVLMFVKLIRFLIGSGDYVKSYKIPLNKRIYVLEDIDALSEIVSHRNKKTEPEDFVKIEKSDSDSDDDSIGLGKKHLNIFVKILIVLIR